MLLKFLQSKNLSKALLLVAGGVSLFRFIRMYRDRQSRIIGYIKFPNKKIYSFENKLGLIYKKVHRKAVVATVQEDYKVKRKDEDVLTETTIANYFQLCNKLDTQEEQNQFMIRIEQFMNTDFEEILKEFPEKNDLDLDKFNNMQEEARNRELEVGQSKNIGRILNYWGVELQQKIEVLLDEKSQVIKNDKGKIACVQFPAKMIKVQENYDEEKKIQIACGSIAFMALLNIFRHCYNDFETFVKNI